MRETVNYSVEFAGSRGRQIDVIAGSEGIWQWYFKCGEFQIKPGGGIQLFCEVPKFWLATCLQKDSPYAPGYVSIHGSKGLEYKLTDYAHHWKRLAWTTVLFPKGIEPEQEIYIQFGSEKFPCYAIAHKYNYVPVSWKVDYNGDGIFYPIWPSMVVRVIPGIPSKIYLVAPSVVSKGEKFSIRGRIEDINSNIGARLEGSINLELIDSSGNIVNGSKRHVQAGPGGTFISENCCINTPGIYRVRAHTDKLSSVLSNPIMAQKKIQKQIVWGDCHCHTIWADGIGTFNYNISYARDEAFLDVFGFAEHLCNRPEFSTSIVDKNGIDWAILGPHMSEALRRAYEPGRFVTILGHEYTPAIETEHPSGDFCIFSPADRWEDLPMAFEYTELIRLAKQHNGLIIPHVGGRWPQWKNLPIDPQVTPLVEIASMHGHFECYAQQGLQLGHKLGFVGMSDGHFGMPGYDNWAQHGRTPNLAHRNYSVQSAITGFIVKSLTRESVFEAMRSRNVYATTGQRVLLNFTIEDTLMGSELVTKNRPHLRIGIYGTAPIALIDIIRGDRRVHQINGFGEMAMNIEWTDPVPISEETWYYIRVTQEDFTLTWSSPIWVTYKGNSSGKEDLIKLPAWNDPPYWPQDRPETCDPAYTQRLESIFAKRNITDRFTNIHQVGVFSEPRGKFALFRARDSKRNNTAVHIHLYIDFPDDRLYIADGEADFGIGLH